MNNNKNELDINMLNSLLAKNGYKITSQREIIFQVMLDNMGKHLSPEEIYEIVNKVDKDIGIATVYRTLLLFEELGIVYKDDFDDNRNRYELSSDEKHHHHHLICKNCNSIIEVKYDLLDEIEDYIKKEYGFAITDHDLKFYGLCQDCQDHIDKERK